MAVGPDRAISEADAAAPQRMARRNRGCTPSADDHAGNASHSAIDGRSELGRGRASREWPARRSRRARQDAASAPVGEEHLRPCAHVFHKDVFIHTPLGPALNLTVTGRAARGDRRLLSPRRRRLHDQRPRRRRGRPRPPHQAQPPDRQRPRLGGRGARAGRRARRRSRSVSSYWLAPALALVAGVYFAENLAYSFKLKKVAFLDVGAHRVRLRSPRARRGHRDATCTSRGTCSPARRCSRCSSASASAGTSSRSRTPASSAPPSRRTRRDPSTSPSRSPARPRR